MKYIRIIRHAKSADAISAQSDHCRQLAPRGQSDGATMQAWLAIQPHPIEWVWTSSATRAQATAEFVSAATNARTVAVPSLYLADADSIVEVIRATPPDLESIAVVAHNPGLTHLTNLLGAESVTGNLVTFGVVLFGLENDWTQLVPGYCHFISLHTPKTTHQTF